MNQRTRGTAGTANLTLLVATVLTVVVVVAYTLSICLALWLSVYLLLLVLGVREGGRRGERECDDVAWLPVLWVLTVRVLIACCGWFDVEYDEEGGGGALWTTEMYALLQLSLTFLLGTLVSTPLLSLCECTWVF